MAEQNLLLRLETDEVFAVAYETRQNSFWHLWKEASNVVIATNIFTT